MIWLVGVEQFGLNTRTPKRGQIASGDHAFYFMTGDGGAGFKKFDISNLKSTENMFKDAHKFNEDIGGWGYLERDEYELRDVR